MSGEAQHARLLLDLPAAAVVTDELAVQHLDGHGPTIVAQARRQQPTHAATRRDARHLVVLRDVRITGFFDGGGGGGSVRHDEPYPCSPRAAIGQTRLWRSRPCGNQEAWPA